MLKQFISRQNIPHKQQKQNKTIKRKGMNNYAKLSNRGNHHSNIKETRRRIRTDSTNKDSLLESRRRKCYVTVRISNEHRKQNLIRERQSKLS